MCCFEKLPPIPLTGSRCPQAIYMTVYLYTYSCFSQRSSHRVHFVGRLEQIMFHINWQIKVECLRPGQLSRQSIRLYQWYLKLNVDVQLFPTSITTENLKMQDINLESCMMSPFNRNSPSYTVAMCGWLNVDMISISRLTRSKSCSVLIHRFLIVLMAYCKQIHVQTMLVEENNLHLSTGC